MKSSGEALRELARRKDAVPIAGVINPYAGLLAKHAGIEAIYVSGGATAASLGLPDLGVIEPADVMGLAGEICAATELPLLVDVDTGFGNELAIARTVKGLVAAGAAGMHLEDQEADKRCGHRPGKRLCSAQQMCQRLAAACDARVDESFVIMARTDAIASEDLEGALARAASYVEAGADMVFLEAATEIAHYKAATDALDVPVLANLTEFGVTPQIKASELADVEVAFALFPLTAFRMMMRAAQQAFAEIASKGSARDLLERMHTRAELYEMLEYHLHEAKLGPDTDDQ